MTWTRMSQKIAANGGEAQGKVRTSTGFSVSEYFGGFEVKEAADFEISCLNSD